MKKCISKNTNKLKEMAVKTSVISTSLLAGINLPVYAEGFDTATNAVNVIKTGFLAIVSGTGVIIVAKNVMDIGTALSSHDTSNLKNNIVGAAGGAIMAGITGVLLAIGIG